MRRSRTYPTTPAFPNTNTTGRSPIHDDGRSGTTTTTTTSTATSATNNAAIVRNIASFLSFSDAVSLTSFPSRTNTSHRNRNADSNDNQYDHPHHQLPFPFTEHQQQQDLPSMPSSSWFVDASSGGGGGGGGDNTDDWSWYAATGTTNTLQSTTSSQLSFVSRRQSSSLFDTETPLTPALVAISPTGIRNSGTCSNTDIVNTTTSSLPHLSSTTAQQQQHYRYNTGDHDDDDDYTNFVEEENDDEYVVMMNDRGDNTNQQQLHSHRTLIPTSTTTHSSSFHDFHRMEELLLERRRRWAQEKITTAVFLHPKSLRSYCLDAYIAAKKIQQEKILRATQVAVAAAGAQADANINPNEAAVYTVPNEQQQLQQEVPETQVEPVVGTPSNRRPHHHYQKPSSSTTTTTQVQATEHHRAVVVIGSHTSNNRMIPSSSYVYKNHDKNLRRMIVHEIIDGVFRSVPISLLLDVLEATGIVSYETISASFKITITSVQHCVTALANIICSVWDTIIHCTTNPFQVLEAIISLQFNAMGKTSEVLASGIQSVATGVGSASNMALYRLSATANISSSTASLAGHFNRSKGSTGNNLNASDGKNSNGGIFNKRLLQKLSAINNAALVVKYQESQDDTCGLTRQAVSRTRRMMHYSVSLRPFVATVKLRPFPSSSSSSTTTPNNNYYDQSQRSSSPNVSVNEQNRYHNRDDSLSGSSQEDSSSGGVHSPFMCTPQSFPPTPHSRQMVIAQRSQFSDDVVFLARDRLRVHDGLGSDNIRTRERSKALEEGKRLAIFACDKDSGIELTCGKHIATKCGDMYYASTRSMVAVLRNCFVYFEFTVLPRLGSPPLATLAIGLSTEEMPPNTLVGAWQSSVGLCTTGQILMAGQWCSPSDPAKFSYGIGSTVGCLVCMDDDKAYETWDGVMIKASVRLNVNGVMVTPPVSTLPMSGAPGSLPMASSALPAFVSRVGTDKGPLSPSSQQGPLLEIPSPTLTLLVPTAEDLYPTVTLQSPATSVVCRFSSEDVMATTREMIGAPAGVTVYAIDGSVVLNDYEDVSS